VLTKNKFGKVKLKVLQRVFTLNVLLFNNLFDSVGLHDAYVDK